MTDSAIVTGARGRLGQAFAWRLARDGYQVRTVDLEDAFPEVCGRLPLLFDFAYQHGEPERHVERVAGHLRDWRRYSGIFVPSSMWVGHDQPYGRAKLAIEQLAVHYIAQGARIVTDRIGYFPGDDVAPDRTEPMYAHHVTGEALYMRVMERLRMEQPVDGEHRRRSMPLPTAHAHG